MRSLVSRAGRSRRNRTRLMALIWAGFGGVALALSPSASAQPFNPCTGSVIPVCALVPILPDLDHDIDLTKDPNALTGQLDPAPTAAPNASPDGG